MNTTDQQAEKTMIDFEESLTGFWEAAGVEPNYPTDIATVKTLLEAMDYALPPDGLAYLERVGLYTAPAEFEASDIVYLVAACDTMRWWNREPSSVHWNRLSQWQRQRANAHDAGDEARLAETNFSFGIRHLLIMLVNAPTRDVRDQVFATMEAKFDAMGLAPTE